MHLICHPYRSFLHAALLLCIEEFTAVFGYDVKTEGHLVTAPGRSPIRVISSSEGVGSRESSPGVNVLTRRRYRIHSAVSYCHHHLHEHNWRLSWLAATGHEGRMATPLELGQTLQGFGALETPGKVL